MSITIGIGKNLKVTPTPTPTANEPEVDTYISGLATALSAAQITRLNTLVYCLKNGLGISALSDLFDIMYLLAGETKESSLRNLIERSHDLTEHSGPLWTQYEGSKSDGVAAYLNAHWKANIDAIHWIQNNAAIGVYCRTNVIETAHFCGCTGNHIGFTPNSNNNYSYLRANQNVGSTGAVSNCNGMHIAQRVAANSVQAFRNNVQYLTDNDPSTGLPSIDLYLCARNNAGVADNLCTNQISFFFLSASLSSDQRLIIQNCVETYMDANGKGVI